VSLAATATLSGQVRRKVTHECGQRNESQNEFSVPDDWAALTAALSSAAMYAPQHLEVVCARV
jgi:hypothetical protein